MTYSLDSTITAGQRGHPELHNAERRAIVALCTDMANVKRLGAKGDGVADDTLAIQAAIDAADVVYLPPGIYRTSASLSLNKRITVAGAGTRASRIAYSGNNRALIVGSDSASTVQFISVRDLSVYGSAAAQCGVYVKGASRFTLARLHLHLFEAGRGIEFEDYTYSGGIYDCIANWCDIGLYAHTTNGLNSFNCMAVVGGAYGEQGRIGILVGNYLLPSNLNEWHTGHSSLITSVTMQSCSEVGLWIADGEAMHVADCYFEDNPVHVRVGHPDHLPIPRVPMLTNNRMGPETPLGIDVQRASGIIVRENILCHRSATGEGVGVRIAEGVAPALLRDNFFEDFQTPYDLPDGMTPPDIY